MKIPSKGELVYVDGYGAAVFAGASKLGTEDAQVLLKFEHTQELREGYGRGVLTVDYDYFKENRVYPEQLPDDDALSKHVSTEKRDERLGS